MMVASFNPTPYGDVNAILKELHDSVRSVLGEQFVGLYLDGSLVNGGFDEDSDIDFVVATRETLSEEQFLNLKAMHARIAALDTPWAIQLEAVSYTHLTLPTSDLV